MTTTTFVGVAARKLPPTRKHRTAIWECMLGTVYARNDAGEVKYFDYDWAGAAAYAGVAPERDPRAAKSWINTLTGARYAGPGSGSSRRVALFILQ